LGTAELREACVRQYRLAHVFGTPTCSAVVRRQTEYGRLEEGVAWLIPGGNFYLFVDTEQQKIILHETATGEEVLVVLDLYVQQEQFLIHRPCIVSVSAHEFMLAHLVTRSA
jgi:hypothetical protein